MPAKKTAHIILRENLLSAFGGRFKVDNLTIGGIGNQGEPVEWKRFIFERGHAAAVLPYDPQTDSVVLISEMRPGIVSANDQKPAGASADDPYALSIVAGMMDKGETGLETARRETEEEIGVKANEIHEVYEIHPGLYVSPGGTSEKIGVYCCTIDSTTVQAAGGLASEGEYITTKVIPFLTFMEMLKAFEITDMKTMVAALWLQQNRELIRQKRLDSVPELGL